MNLKKTRHFQCLLGCLFFSGISEQASAMPTLTMQSAFETAFGQAPPMTRNVQYPKGQVAYTLHPLTLISLSTTRAALIVAEDTSGGNPIRGAAAVAYLDWQSGEWRPVHTWFEFIQAGSFGTAFTDEKALYSNAMPPLFVGESETSGTGAVTTWYNLVSLNQNGPVSWGFIHAQGTLNAVTGGYMADGDGYVGCGGYAFTSSLSPPAKMGDLVRVTYKGWMTAGGDGAKARDFLISADVVSQQCKLKLQPAIRIPNCGD